MHLFAITILHVVYILSVTSCNNCMHIGAFEVIIGIIDIISTLLLFSILQKLSLARDLPSFLIDLKMLLVSQSFY